MLNCVARHWVLLGAIVVSVGCGGGPSSGNSQIDNPMDAASSGQGGLPDARPDSSRGGAGGAPVTPTDSSTNAGGASGIRCRLD
jgi:hypothetical protein